MKQPTIIEIHVKSMDEHGIEKEFYFYSWEELMRWRKNPFSNTGRSMK